MTASSAVSMAGTRRSGLPMIDASSAGRAWGAGTWRLHSSALFFVVSSALLAGILMLAPTAQGRGEVSLSLDVTFSLDGTISVTLPDGTSVGSTSGPPTVIPAGYYTLRLSGPGACTELPYFELKGPGENILDNMDLGEMQATDIAVFQPSSTYTWRSDAIPGVVYTFTTSAEVEGTRPALVSSGSRILPGPRSTVSSHDVVGSAILPFRGTLVGGVSTAGRLTFAYKGKSITTLKAGRYTIAVNDKSATSGFMLEKANTRHVAVSVTGTAFVGTRSASVDLSAGKWVFVPSLHGKQTRSIVVS